jgi:hypothetical protein
VAHVPAGPSVHKTLLPPVYGPRPWGADLQEGGPSQWMHVQPLAPAGLARRGLLSRAGVLING